MSMDTKDHVKAMLDSLGLDPANDPELGRTPERVATLLEELFSGVHADKPALSMFDVDNGDPVVVCALPFKSMCVHHLLPFFGFIDIAYIPSDQAAGFGGFLRVIEHYAKQPQVQERLVEQVADHLQESLHPKGLLVRCRARQMCVEMRRSSSPATFVSMASRGSLTDGELRTQILAQFQADERQL